MMPDTRSRYLVFRLEDADRIQWRQVLDTTAETPDDALQEAVESDHSLPPGRYAVVAFEDWGEYRAQISRKATVERHP